MKSKRKIIDIAILLCYVGLIYSTLYVMPSIFLLFRKVFKRSLKIIANTSLALTLLALLYLFLHRLKRRRFAVYLGLFTILLIYAFLIMRYTPIISEKIHLVEYGFLSYLALRVFSAEGGSATNSAKSGLGGKDSRPRDRAYLYVVATVIIVGYCDELIQWLLPNRVYELRDVALNILSGLLGLALIRILA